MCGRFACSRTAEQIQFKLHHDQVTQTNVKWINKDRYVPRYNVCPSTHVATLHCTEQNEWVLQPMKWGFVPSWANVNPLVKPINARAETLNTRSMFDQSKKNKRCVVIADGFYEWKQAKKDKKVPYYIKRKDNQFMLFAGFYAASKAHGVVGETTCVIVTTEASSQFAWLHTRMPVILDPEDVATWIDPSIPWKEAQTLLLPYEDDLVIYQVTQDVGSTHAQSPDMIMPVDQIKSSINQFLVKRDPFSHDVPVKKEEVKEEVKEETPEVEQEAPEGRLEQLKIHQRGKKRKRQEAPKKITDFFSRH